MRLDELSVEARKYRTKGPLAAIGMVLLYLSMILQVLEKRPVQAICMTFCLAALIPTLLRWYRMTVKNQILEALREGERRAEPASSPNGDPAPPLDNSGVAVGPPSVR